LTFQRSAEGERLNVSELWEPWLKDAWKQIPVGVVVE